MYCALYVYSTLHIASEDSKTFLMEGHEMKLQVKYRWERLCFFNALGCCAALLARLTSAVMLCDFSYSRFYQYCLSSHWKRCPLLQLISPHFWDVARCWHICHGLGERDTRGYGAGWTPFPNKALHPSSPAGSRNKLDIQGYHRYHKYLSLWKRYAIHGNRHFSATQALLSWICLWVKALLEVIQ